MKRAVDEAIAFDGRRHEYALRASTRASASSPIRFCPWCGSLLFRTTPPALSKNKKAATPGRKVARR